MKIRKTIASVVFKLMPADPGYGPPLPELLNIRWPDMLTPPDVLLGAADKVVYPVKHGILKLIGGRR